MTTNIRMLAIESSTGVRNLTFAEPAFQPKNRGLLIHHEEHNGSVPEELVSALIVLWCMIRTDAALLAAAARFPRLAASGIVTSLHVGEEDPTRTLTIKALVIMTTDGTHTIVLPAVPTFEGMRVQYDVTEPDPPEPVYEALVQLWQVVRKTPLAGRGHLDASIVVPMAWERPS